MRRLVFSFLFTACSVACAQNPPPPTPPVEREVKGQTIVSNQLPAADLTFADDFRYVGSQVVNLYGTAFAEQHLFVAGHTSGPVDRFYWIQFEHYLPTNSHTYNYRPERTTDIGGLQFIYDVRAFTDYGGANRDPRSDGAALVALLAKHNLAFPARMARVRMFHLPNPDRRSELMIIYGETLSPQSPTPVDAGGTSLDIESPAEAKLFLQHALQGLRLRRHVASANSPR
ncbi:MAG TPA: hypothetical protein VF105_07845 [Gemmatimonadaceae bacterium]